MGESRGGSMGDSMDGGRAVSLVVLLLSMIVFGLAGFGAYGPVGGLAGILGGTLLGMVVYIAIRARNFRSSSLGERPAPEVLELPPEQALHILSAMMNRDGAATSLSSPLLTALADLRDRAETDLEAALEGCLELQRQHPRSPAVPAELARLLARRGDPQATASAASQAIDLAVKGGMNGLAARSFEELDPHFREYLELSSGSWAALERALEARQLEEERTWVSRLRAESGDA